MENKRALDAVHVVLVEPVDKTFAIKSVEYAFAITKSRAVKETKDKSGK